MPCVARILATFTLLALAARAQTPPAAEPSARRSRPISGEVAASLSAAMPKYAPPPKPVEKKPEDDVDLREVDKPKNQILRLPKYIVQEDRPAVFRERDVNTKQGLSGLAMKRYVTEADRALNRYTIPLFASWSPGSGSATEERALAMYAEDERLQNISDLKSDAATAKRVGDKAGADYISRNVNDTYMRRSDYGWQSSKGK